MWVLKYIGGLIKNENNMIIPHFIFKDKTTQYEVMFKPNSYLQLFGSKRSI